MCLVLIGFVLAALVWLVVCVYLGLFAYVVDFVVVFALWLVVLSCVLWLLLFCDVFSLRCVCVFVFRPSLVSVELFGLFAMFVCVLAGLLVLRCVALWVHSC